MTTDEIAWPSDIKMFKNSDPSKMWLDVTNPRFMNWVRIATLPSFRKLWARINSNLPAGTYTLKVTNRKIKFIKTTQSVSSKLKNISY